MKEIFSFGLVLVFNFCNFSNNNSIALGKIPLSSPFKESYLIIKYCFHFQIIQKFLVGSHISNIFRIIPDDSIGFASPCLPTIFFFRLF